MKDPVIEVMVDPVAEARRYVENAKTTLSTNGKFDMETNCYQDPKYVKAAGHYLWNAVLIILDAIFEVKTRSRPHPDIIDRCAAMLTKAVRVSPLIYHQSSGQSSEY